eukprot:TRINITY_DN10943_c0_g1_i3.p3 TRINITY_DN10943_c0_g1~~TRINITY_DN10943_c0_g1_i3.p3  ORF type:complete len:312 (-),score=78.14 TRINITY_DN10943_c0_g1_i3:1013-1948(-)
MQELTPLFTRYAGLPMQWTLRFYVNRQLPKKHCQSCVCGQPLARCREDPCQPELAIAAQAEYRCLATGYGSNQTISQKALRSNTNLQNTNDSKARCDRCGVCCRQGGPALHVQDLPLIQDGTIQLADIVTLRPGERVYDQPAQQLLKLDSEILKIKGRDNTWTCLFFSPEGNACGIYETRPVECDLLFCKDTAPLAAMYEKDRLTRSDILPEGHPLLDLIAEHGSRCAPDLVEETAKAARGGTQDAGAALREMVLYDQEMRRLVAEKSGMGRGVNEFLFGRPLKVLLRTMNINVYDMGDTIRFDFAPGEQS